MNKKLQRMLTTQPLEPRAIESTETIDKGKTQHVVFPVEPDANYPDALVANYVFFLAGILKIGVPGC